MFSVLGIGDPEWDATVASIPGCDVHFLSGYAAAHATEDDLPLLAVWRDASGVIAKPFALRSIPGSGRSDIASLYGYGGPVSSGWTFESHRASRFDEEFTAWAASMGAVAEFCAFHPLLDGWRQPLAAAVGVPVGHDLPMRKPVVLMEVARHDEAILADMQPDKRHNIARAKRSGASAYQVIPTEKTIAVFWSLYCETLARHKAAARWRLPPTYFSGYFDKLPHNAALFFASASDQVEVASIALGYRATAYYHFSGRRGRSALTDLIVFEIARWARDRGCDRLHLGGGATSAPDDRLLAYKLGFGPSRIHTRTWFRVFDPAAYRELSDAAARRVGPTFAASTYEPSYRREAA